MSMICRIEAASLLYCLSSDSPRGIAKMQITSAAAESKRCTKIGGGFLRAGGLKKWEIHCVARGTEVYDDE